MQTANEIAKKIIENSKDEMEFNILSIFEDSFPTKHVNFSDPVTKDNESFYPEVNDSDAAPIVQYDSDKSYPEEKQTVPKNIIKALQDTINENKKKVDIADEEENGENYKIYAAVVDVSQKLHDLLSDGSIESFKNAQLLLSSLMTPILVHIPDEVKIYIYTNGQPTSLKEIIKLIKS